MTRLAALLGLVVLAACGADGEPVTPSVNTTIRATPDGVSTSTGLSLRKGPVTLGVSL